MADLRIGEARLGGDEEAAVVARLAGEVIAGDDRPGPGVGKGRAVARVVEDAELVRPGVLQRGDVVDHQPPGLGAGCFGADLAGDVAKRERAIAAEKPRIGHRHSLSSMARPAGRESPA